MGHMGRSALMLGGSAPMLGRSAPMLGSGALSRYLDDDHSGVWVGLGHVYGGSCS